MLTFAMQLQYARTTLTGIVSMACLAVIISTHTFVDDVCRFDANSVPAEGRPFEAALY